MKPSYHILNGDALKAQFPSDLGGEIIVARECFVDGPVKAKNLDDLFELRANFMQSYDSEFTIEVYREKALAEFQKIMAIPEEAEVNLWFEDDLFCQVNLWFVMHLLMRHTSCKSIFLIRPPFQNQYGFGGVSQSELRHLFEARVALTQLDDWAKLWPLYQSENLEGLRSAGMSLAPSYPFLTKVMAAHLDRFPTDGKLGKPESLLKEIMTTLNTKDFVPVFRAFCEQGAIYGFGDLQVKRLFDKILNESALK